MIDKLKIEQDFPGLSGLTYLNTAAESIPPTVTKNAVCQYLEDKLLGMNGRDAHFAREQKAREAAAQLLGFQTDEIGFCSCSAEAYNLLATALDLKSEDEVVINDLDFPSGSTPWLALRTKPQVKLWKSEGGALQIADLIPLLNHKTKLVQLSFVSFYNGWRIDWKPLVKAVRELAPQAVIAADVTQALGRCVMDLRDADIVISSTHKWLLGLHGGCVVGVPQKSAAKLTTAAGGWYHLHNGFASDRFERVSVKQGAASYSVGMPSFAPIYALEASISYLLSVGVEQIASYADPLTHQVYQGLQDLNIQPLAPWVEGNSSGIVSFIHPQSERIQQKLLEQNIHIMHQAGRMRVSVHGYNTQQDIERLLAVLREIV